MNGHEVAGTCEYDSDVVVASDRRRVVTVLTPDTIQWPGALHSLLH